MKRGRAAVVLTVIGVVAWPRPTASQAKLPDIMQRASAYVTAFITTFANVVAEEEYVQDTTAPRRHRELRSDYLLVKPPGQDEWYEFRDVYEVNGVPVAGREQRMTDLFLNPPANLTDRLRAVMLAGSRYNLEDMGTLDKPLLALSFLQAHLVGRFSFTVGRFDGSVGPGVRIVQFREILRPTILRNGVRDLPSRGLYWIEETSGRVVKTELDFDTSYVVTTFRFDPDLLADVPIEMTQNWRLGRGGITQLTARSTYRRFRRFTVQTDEKIR